MKSLTHLLERNRAWADGRRASDPQFFDRLCDIQQPKYMWIGCSDSRVSANEIVGMGSGEVFVHRNVANIVTPGDTNSMAVVQYAVERLDVRHIIICGHYEGVDHRVVEHLVDEEISIGDYVLTNGAIAAVVLVDAIVRLIPGVLGDDQSAVDDSFRQGLLEAPQYTRPAEFRGWKVPEVLLGGNHGEIAKWRKEQSQKRTRKNRPDLLD